MMSSRVSIVIPVFNEGAQIGASLEVIRAHVIPTGVVHQFILVDDGSRDNTWEALTALSLVHSDIRAIRLSRNFGKEAALAAGLDVADGDACIVMDSDLQHPPSVIPEMIRLWREEKFPIVEAVKKSRGSESAINKYGARLFYGTMRRVAGLDLRQASDFKLLDARIVAAWKLLHERQTFFRGLTSWIGFRHARVYFEVAPRAHGGSRWSKLKLFKYAITAITSFSSMPMQMVTTLGVIFLLGALPLLVQTLYNKFCGVAVSGFTTVIALLLIVGSILMISLGIIGTYIAQIFEEVKRRPRYFVADTLERKKVDGDRPE